MRHGRGFVASTLLLGCTALLIGCEEKSTMMSARKPSAAKPSAAKPSLAIAQRPPAPKVEEDRAQALNASELNEERIAAPNEDAKIPSRLIIDQGQQIGPAGQMAATDQGVVMITRDDEILQARGVFPKAPGPEKARFTRVAGSVNDFYAVARGPLLLRKRAYWIKDGKLVRRALDNSSGLEILANDARNGTRVVAEDVPDAPAHAFYVSNPVGDEAPRAKLWTEGVGSVSVSPEGAGASSIAVAKVDRDLFVVAIDARSAMTPVHGRSVRFKAGKPELDADVVMWVGSSSQTSSEVFASATPFGVRAFLPIERDTSHFGLVMLDLGRAPKLDPKATFRAYPNGIDVAPVASAAFCNSAFVAYVRPETASPGSREVLEIAEIRDSGLGPAEFIDSARGFANLSLAAATNSAVLAYVADFRTFATTLRCHHPR